MDRIIAIDNLRGIAFIFMVIQHIFYFYDVSNLYKTSLSKNILISSSGMIARCMFIFLAGLSLSLVKDKKINLGKRLNRSLLILFHAFAISIVTYLLYPEVFVRFGILHFIGIATLICSFLVPYPKLLFFVAIISVLFKFPSINPFIDTITGSQVHYNMMDWFPLFPWISLMIIGILFGQLIDLKFLNQIKLLSNNNFITFLGENSLELYTIHIILLILFYSLKK